MTKLTTIAQLLLQLTQTTDKIEQLVKQGGGSGGGGGGDSGGGDVDLTEVIERLTALGQQHTQIKTSVAALSREPSILDRLAALEDKMDEVYGHDHSDDVLIRFIEKTDIVDDELYVRNIPEEVRTAVTGIGNCVFQNFKRLESAVFPNATKVGIQSFNGCEVLTEASFPEAVSIGLKSFFGCSAMITVNFPKLPSIPESAFNGCSSLTAVSFPEVIDIGISAFQGAVALTDPDFPKALTIRGSAFKGCTALTNVEFLNVTEIFANAFESCTSLSTISLPKTASLGISVFSGCSSLLEASLPVVDSIGANAFDGNSTLESVSLPTDKTVYVASQAFRNCSNLEFQENLTVRVPSGGNNYSGSGSCPEVFYGCSKLKKIHVTGTDILPAYCFTNCTSLEEVQFDGTAINTRVFQGCPSLKKVIALNLDHFNGDSNYYRHYTFSGDKALEKVLMPKITSLGENVFYNAGLKTAYFPSLERITGPEAFRSNPLKWVYLPNYLGKTANDHTMHDGTFRYCTDLEYVLLPKITYVSSYNFIGCKNIILLGLPFVTKYERQYTGEGYEIYAPFSQSEAGNEAQVKYVDYRMQTSVPTLITAGKNPAKANQIFPGWYDQDSNKIPTKYIVPDALYDDWVVNPSFVDCADCVIKQSVFESDPNHPEYPWVTDPTILDDYFNA